MNPAHLHWMLNPRPGVGTAFTLLPLVMARLKRSEELKASASGSSRATMRLVSASPAAHHENR